MTERPIMAYYENEESVHIFHDKSPALWTSSGALSLCGIETSLYDERVTILIDGRAYVTDEQAAEAVDKMTGLICRRCLERYQSGDEL